MNNMIRQETDDSVLYRWKVFEPWRQRFVAVLTTRIGGTSSAPLDGLNLGPQVKDNPENLRQNRKLTAAVLNLPDAAWNMCNQVHGTRIAALSDLREPENLPVSGTLSKPGEIPKEPPFRNCDGILVDKAQQICGILLADCHPVVLYDPVLHIAGIVHAGWRGTLAGIPGKLVERMANAGSKPSNLFAAVGPGIGPCCYTVGQDVAISFQNDVKNCENYLVQDGLNQWRLDLEEVNRCTLLAAGVPASQIEKGGLCTACNTDEFFSWRKENGNTGRHAALAALY